MTEKLSGTLLRLVFSPEHAAGCLGALTQPWHDSKAAHKHSGWHVMAAIVLKRVELRHGSHERYSFGVSSGAAKPHGSIHRQAVDAMFEPCL